MAGKPKPQTPRITTEQREQIREILLEHYETIPMFLVVDEKTMYIDNAFQVEVSEKVAKKLIRDLVFIDFENNKPKPIRSHKELYGVGNDIHKTRAKRKRLKEAHERLEKLESLITELPVLIERQRYKIRKLEREEDNLGDVGREEE